MTKVDVGIIKIYVLFDPRTEETRYVGKTINTLGRRLNDHISAARRRENSHKAKWIRSLLRNNTRPGIELLEEVTGNNWPERERYWIAQFPNLTNGTEGGMGGTGCKPSAKTRRQMSETAKKRCEDPKERERLKTIGNHGSHEPLPGVMNPSVKLTEEEVYRIRELSTQGALYCELAEMFAITRSNVRRIVCRETWKHLPETVGTVQEEELAQLGKVRQIRSAGVKLKEWEVVLIRELAATGVKGVDLAAAFEISQQNICSVVKRRSWKHIPEPRKVP